MSNNFVATYEELLQFLQIYKDDLFYVDINPTSPPDGARQFAITTFPDEIAGPVVRAIHRGTRPPRTTPAVRARVDVSQFTLPLDVGVNIDAMNPGGNPPPARLAAADWVRLVFYSPAHHWTLADAFKHFDPIINGYHQLGVKVLLIVNHQTFGEGEGYVWPQMTPARWEEFTARFVPVVAQVAAHYGERVAAYQIWNEGDLPNNPAGVYIPPTDFSLLLKRTADVIRQYAPETKIVMQGLASNLNNAIQYTKDISRKLDNRLPVDALAVHPYGFGAPGDTTIFSRFGNIQLVIDAFEKAFPNLPIWFTEVGATGTDNPDYWDDVARYMHNLYHYVRSQANRVQNVIWYAWSDAMDAARKTNGLVTHDQQPKPHVYDTFFNEVCNLD
jgi:hypothetical protein